MRSRIGVVKVGGEGDKFLSKHMATKHMVMEHGRTRV